MLIKGSCTDSTELRIRDNVQDGQIDFKWNPSNFRYVFRIINAGKDALETRETMGEMFLGFAGGFDSIWLSSVRYEDSMPI